MATMTRTMTMMARTTRPTMSHTHHGIPERRKRRRRSQEDEKKNKEEDKERRRQLNKK